MKYVVDWVENLCKVNENQLTPPRFIIQLLMHIKFVKHILFTDEDSKIDN